MRSLRFRLLIMISLVVVVAIGTVAVYVRQRTVNRIERFVVDVNAQDPRVISTLLRTSTQLKEPRDIQALVKKLAQATGQRIIFIDPSHHVIGDSEGLLLGQLLAATDLHSDGVPLAGPFPISPLAFAKLPPGTTPGTLVVMPGLDATGNAPGAVYLQEAPKNAVRIGYNLANNATAPAEDRFIQGVNDSLLVATCLAGTLGVVLTNVLSARILRPVRALTNAARQMQQGDLTQRVYVKGKDEFGDLARAFNAMAESLVHSEQLRRNLVGDVAHDLRTPLTNIRGYLEALEDGVVQATPRVMLSLKEEVLLLNRLIDDLQEVALAEAGQLRLICRPVDLAQILEQAAAVVAPQVARHQVTLTTHVTGSLPPVQADTERVAQVLRNLLNNAITHTPAGGTIRLEAAVEANSGNSVAVRVCDSGEGFLPNTSPISLSASTGSIRRAAGPPAAPG